MQSSPEKSSGVNSPFSQSSKSSNIFDVIGSDGTEVEDMLESPAITEDAAPGLQSPLSSPNKATDEQNYIKDDPLAEIMEVFVVVSVSEELCAVLSRGADSELYRSWMPYALL